MNEFEQDYYQAWQDALEKKGRVQQVKIFVSKDALSVPISFDENDAKTGSDRETFESLRMWYCWMQVRRDFGEVLLSRKLIRIDKVEVRRCLIACFKRTDTKFRQICKCKDGIPGLGGKVKALELGRSGSNNVVNLENPHRLPEEQRHKSADMLEDPTGQGVPAYGLEFVRAWDSTAVSVISLMPFVFSLAFVAVWIGVSVGTYEVDAQVATQTAFTVAAFIVTAGKCLRPLLLGQADMVPQAHC